ncbi:nuclear transport factor 2 family protein [Geodermatophilus siccatus]|uniref:nuclear transport factor 2 family protein n=1 Tax=Geodermatophilus siccatus TaxID=1137991 RepID=UPI0011134EEE
MSRFAALVDAFDAGRVHELVADTTEDHRYSDPFSGERRGAAAHAALMHTVLERFPDRRMHLLECWVAAGAEVAEYSWTGTPAGGGDPVEVLFVAVLESPDRADLTPLPGLLAGCRSCSAGSARGTPEVPAPVVVRGGWPWVRAPGSRRNAPAPRR